MNKPHRPNKHSLTLKGHRTSVSLEDPFWIQFKIIAKEKKIALNELATEIDNALSISVANSFNAIFFSLAIILNCIQKGSSKLTLVRCPLSVKECLFGL